MPSLYDVRHPLLSGWVERRSGMSNFQEVFYADGVDYRRGSPHLSYWPLHDRLVATIRSQLTHLADAGLPLRVLELGAGHGAFTEPALAFGCEVTAIEMSRPSIDELNRRIGQNPAFTVSYDPAGTSVWCRVTSPCCSACQSCTTSPTTWQPWSERPITCCQVDRSSHSKIPSGMTGCPVVRFGSTDLAMGFGDWGRGTSGRPWPPGFVAGKASTTN